MCHFGLCHPKQPQVASDKLIGYVWAENIGWINLDPNDADPNTGIPKVYVPLPVTLPDTSNSYQVPLVTLLLLSSEEPPQLRLSLFQVMVLSSHTGSIHLIRYQYAPAAFAVRCFEQGSAMLRLPQNKENKCAILS